MAVALHNGDRGGGCRFGLSGLGYGGSGKHGGRVTVALTVALTVAVAAVY